MRDFISLFINGKPVDVRGEDALLTLSDYLRKRQHLTGTKVVCAEGDCGSCSVLIGRVEDPHPNPLPEYRARGPESHRQCEMPFEKFSYSVAYFPPKASSCSWLPRSMIRPCSSTRI